jgi:hypothetical protein
MGEKHNLLTLVDVNVINGTTKGKFKCDCGNDIITLLTSVRSGRTSSCGCARGLPEGEAALNGLMATYKFQASKKDITFNLSKDDFVRLTSGLCHYCGVKPSNRYKHTCRTKGIYLYNGIDRLNNLIGYEPENCTSCCTRCNHAKHTMSREEFISLAYKIAACQMSKL